MADISARSADVLGQFPQLKTYNHGVALFPLRDDLTEEKVVSAIEGATAKILEAIPWLAGQVVHEAGENGSSGVLRMAPWPVKAPRSTLVRVKDCKDLLPTYGVMLEADGPLCMLDGNIICPFPGFPLPYDTAKIGPAPPMMLQINFVKGGYLLSFSNQHNMMDGTGLFTTISLLALALRGADFPPDLIKAADQDPRTVIRLLDPYEPMLDHSHLVKPANAPPPATPRGTPKWVSLRFHKEQLAEITKQAEDVDGFDPDVAFVSPNDALCALYWKRLAAVRIATGLAPETISKFSRAIDIRTALNVSPGYLGQMVYQAASRMTFQDLVSAPLSTIASRLHKDLDDTNNEFSARSYATFVNSVKDKQTLLYAGGFSPVTDVGHSSMMNAKVCGFDFGILGKADLGRRPKLAPVSGLFYIFPPEASGDLLVVFCLPEMELEALRNDPEWSRCTSYIEEDVALKVEAAP